MFKHLRIILRAKDAQMKRVLSYLLKNFKVMPYIGLSALGRRDLFG